MANPEHVEIVNSGADEFLKWRELNPTEKLDLSDRFINDATFDGFNFGNADFTRTNFTKCELTNCNFSGAQLANLKFSHSEVTDSNFTKSTFFSSELFANTFKCCLFKECVLVATTLHKVDLIQSDFTQAMLGGTILADCSLSGVVGLETVQHIASSSLAFDTLMNTKECLNAKFLRGVGFSDDLICYLPSLVSEPFQFYSVFISYSHKDKAFARRLYDTLQGRGIRCWLDEKQLLPGDDIRASIDHGIKVWDKVLLCASKDSLNSNWCDKEIRKAFSKEEQLNSKPSDNIRSLIPLNLDGYLFSDEWQSPYATDIRERLAPDFRNWKNNHDKFEREVDNVVKALALNDRLREPPPKPLLGSESE